MHFIAWLALVLSVTGFVWRFIIDMDKIDISFVRLTLETVIIVLLSLRVLGII